MLYVRAALAFVVLPGTADVLVPWLVWSPSQGRFDVGAARLLGLVPMAAGAAALVWCVCDFARLGRGTLAPVDPPKVLLTRGLYRWVRNPMYAANALIIGGEAVVFESWRILGWAGIAVAAFHVFVVGYEEPSLRRRFGEAYERYRRTVPRWLPRPPS